LKRTNSFKVRRYLRKNIRKNEGLYNISKSLFRTYQESTHFLHTLPNYLIIGAVKSGTSSLYSYLIEHPNVKPALTKQIHFFDKYYDRGINWYKTNFPLKLSMKGNITGEATPFYFIHPLAPQRILKISPQVKLIVMLRNPIDRAYSHYQMEARHDKEKFSFEKAIEMENSWIEDQFKKLKNNSNYYNQDFFSRSYLYTGLYYEHLKRWIEVFPKERYLIVNSDEFNEKPDLWYNKTLEFLELPKYSLKKYEKMKKGKYSPMKESTRKNLQEFYKPHNEKLYKYLSINFNWDN